MILLALGPVIYAQKQEEAIKQAPIFSVIMAVLTIIVMVLGIIIQKRWKD
jgi:hypothetical protein